MAKTVELWDLCNDCDKVSNSTESMRYYRTTEYTSNLPQGIDGQLGGGSGTLVFFNSLGNQMGVQYWYQHLTGDIYARPKINEGEFSHWSRISSAEQVIANSLFKPESTPEITNANAPQPSGIYRTNENTTGLPNGIDKKWGILQHFNENANTGACYQLFSPIDGNGKGKLYIRIMSSNNGTVQVPEWSMLDVSKLIEIQNQVYTHPTRTATDIDAEIQNDYVATTEEVTLAGNFPSGVSKHGLLKTFRTPLGFTKQTYTPLEGEFRGYEYSRTGNPVTTFDEGQPRVVTQDWGQWNTGSENSLQISFVGNLDVKDPLELITNLRQKVGDKVFYNYFNNNSLKLTPSKGSTDELGIASIVRTAVLTSDDSHDKDQFVYQTAYTEKGNKVYVRSSVKDSGHNFTWGEWKDLTATGTGQSFNLKQELDSWTI